MRRTFGVLRLSSVSVAAERSEQRGVARARCVKNEENEEKIRREVQCSFGELWRRNDLPMFAMGGILQERGIGWGTRGNERSCWAGH